VLSSGKSKLRSADDQMYVFAAFSLDYHKIRFASIEIFAEVLTRREISDRDGLACHNLL
jgi:hypothetical protein